MQTKLDSRHPERVLLVEMYRLMILIRTFEEAVAEVMRNGEMVGPAHLSIGHEAAIVGACVSLRRDDYMVGTHRSHGHPLAKGSDPRALMAELLGRETGVNHGRGGSMHLADFSVGSLGETSIVGSGLPVAVGGGLSIRLRKTDGVVLAFFGEAASNEGTFHEAMNFAAVWRLPVIFYCENNLYGVTTAFSEVSMLANVADRAAAYGIPGRIVDGQDPVECWRATTEAVARARRGDGPTLVEAKTYRFVEHSEGRLLNYRSAAEVEAWRTRDPVPTFRDRLEVDGVLDKSQLEAIDSATSIQIADALAFARQSPYPDRRDLFANLFANPGPQQKVT